MSDYTPDMDDMRAAWVDYSVVSALASPVAEFDRFIAKVKADALREAAYALVARAGLLKPMHGEHPAVKELLERADRIEGEA